VKGSDGTLLGSAGDTVYAHGTPRTSHGTNVDVSGGNFIALGSGE